MSNLVQPIFKEGEVYQAKNGCLAKVLVNDMSGAYPLCVLFRWPDGLKEIKMMRRNGMCHASSDTRYDLIPPTPTVVKEWWDNVDHNNIWPGYSSRIQADQNAFEGRIGVDHRILWSNGTTTIYREGL